MSTLPPPKTNEFPEDSLEKQAYSIAESLSEFIPIMNDRNRLGFNLLKYLKGEGDTPETIAWNSKLSLQGITKEKLAQILSEETAKINK